jgi:hypothetical protein
LGKAHRIVDRAPRAYAVEDDCSASDRHRWAYLGLQELSSDRTRQAIAHSAAGRQHEVGPKTARDIRLVGVLGDRYHPTTGSHVSQRRNREHADRPTAEYDDGIVFVERGLLNRVKAAGERLDKHCPGVGQPLGNLVQLRLVGYEPLAPAAARITTVPGLDTGPDYSAGDVATVAEVTVTTRGAKIVDAANRTVKRRRETDAVARSHGGHFLASFVDDTDDLVSKNKRGRSQR